MTGQQIATPAEAWAGDDEQQIIAVGPLGQVYTRIRGVWWSAGRREALLPDALDYPLTVLRPDVPMSESSGQGDRQASAKLRQGLVDREAEPEHNEVTVGALARAAALSAGDPDWMNVTRWPRTTAAVDREALAEVVVGHVPVLGVTARVVGCCCMDRVFHRNETWGEHLADAVLAMLREAGLLAEGEEWGYTRGSSAIFSMPSEDMARAVARTASTTARVVRRRVTEWVEVP